MQSGLHHADGQLALVNYREMEDPLRHVTRGLIASSGTPDPLPEPASNPMRGLLKSPAARAAEAANTAEFAAKKAADLNTAERRQLAKEGKALPDGSFPIRDSTDLQAAMTRAHQGGNETAAKGLIRKRAKQLGVKLPSGY